MKKWFRNFSTTFRNSLTNRDFYQNIKKFSFWQPIIYIFSLVFALLLIKVLVFGGIILVQRSQVFDFIGSFYTKSLEIYPKDFEISIKNDKVSINKETPYSINLPSDFIDTGASHLVTFDTKSETENISGKPPFIYVTSKKMLVINPQTKNTQFEILASDFDQPTKITKSDYTKFISEIDSILKYIQKSWVLVFVIVVITVPIVGGLFQTIGLLIYLMLLVLILYFVAQIFKLKIKFVDVYKMSIYGLTVPIIFTTFLSAFGLN